MNGKRPIGVAMLAIHKYIEAAWAIVGSVVLVAFPNVFHAARDYPFRTRLGWALLLLLLACLTYLWAQGLWNLKNWARRLLIVLVLLFVYPVRSFSGISPVFKLLPSGPIREIMGLIFLIVLLVYLFSPRVRQAFGVDSKSRRWQFAAGILCLSLTAFVVYKSKPEFRAFQWHRQHGDTITVSGVSLPIYKWDAPDQDCEPQALRITGFHNRGPLVRDETYFITVDGNKDESVLTPAQRAEAKIVELKESHYVRVSSFQLVIAKQTLSCVRNDEFSHWIDCYGNGPIYQVHFAGADAALERFNWMMASAR